MKTKKNSKKAKVDFKSTRYYSEVIAPHSAMKQEVKSLGGARALLLTFPDTLTSNAIAILEASKAQENYKVLQSFVQPYKKTGKYSAFKLRQSIYSNESALIEQMKLKV
jgi:hypothetical protein